MKIRIHYCYLIFVNLLNYFKNTFVLNTITLNHLTVTSSELLKVQLQDENEREVTFDLNKENTIQLVEWLILKVLNKE